MRATGSQSQPRIDSPWRPKAASPRTGQEREAQRLRAEKPTKWEDGAEGIRRQPDSIWRKERNKPCIECWGN